MLLLAHNSHSVFGETIGCVPLHIELDYSLHTTTIQASHTTNMSSVLNSIRANAISSHINVNIMNI